ncbi:tyrosine-type recombinase/integrase [Pseudomonas alkylphenolica]|uniref:tyrosine-type recombinase/integrase n=1 Tax=Pseudomonas alkylphenolica TaxID=237609 RepID=UPI00315D6292
MSDRRFVHFSKYLSGEISPETGLPARTSNYIARVLRRTLDFLEYVHKKFAPYATWVIKAKKEKRTDQRGRSHSAWFHSCIPVEESPEARLPISTAVIKKLKSGVVELWPESKSDNSYHLQRRKTLLIVVLEKLGCRRSEAAQIQVPEIYKAYNSLYKRPLLKIPNVKGKRKFRYVPVSRVILSTWIDYIETSRATILHSRGVIKDHGFLFVSVKDATPLSIDYITTEINELRHLLNIQDPCHPHLFRHHFVTEMVKLLVVRTQARSKDTFTQMLIDDARLFKELREWVGHRSVESLAIYIDLAFQELADLPKIYDEARSRVAIDDCISVLDELRSRYDSGDLSDVEYGFLAREILEASRSEIGPTCS